ncbi:hypothetical protein LTR36_000762 [Oleoguttula mirabilis]|uniref:Uncharacterized protein n=1 Tax=Oleoguttula mirabilis TaxID=1507867 RepID=A0AAV9J3H9_9PEZI|nr:hypothetical protein LTR36_000762 [Oleoguttula mirabilis]
MKGRERKEQERLRWERAFEGWEEGVAEAVEAKRARDDALPTKQWVDEEMERQVQGTWGRQVLLAGFEEAVDEDVRKARENLVWKQQMIDRLERKKASYQQQQQQASPSVSVHERIAPLSVSTQEQTAPPSVVEQPPPRRYQPWGSKARSRPSLLRMGQAPPVPSPVEEEQPAPMPVEQESRIASWASEVASQTTYPMKRPFSIGCPPEEVIFRCGLGPKPVVPARPTAFRKASRRTPLVDETTCREVVVDDVRIPANIDERPAAVCRTEPPPPPPPSGESDVDDAIIIDHDEWQSRLELAEAHRLERVQQTEPEPEPETETSASFVDRIKSWAGKAWTAVKRTIWG